MDRPIKRFHNTFRIVFTMIFGSLAQALAAVSPPAFSPHADSRRNARGRRRNGNAARATKPTRSERCAGFSPRSSRAPSSPTTAYCRASIVSEPIVIMPSAKRWPVSSAFLSLRCPRIGRPLPLITARCTPPASLGVSETAQRMAHNLLAAPGRGCGRHSGIAPSPSRASASASARNLSFHSARASSKPPRAPSASCRESTAAFRQPSASPVPGAKRRRGLPHRRQARSLDGAIASGSAGHYYRLP